MEVAGKILSILGSLGILLYGMKILSEGIQKSAGESLHKILGFMTGNRFSAVFTGLLVTAIIQSSGATTVMVVSFVNAGIMTLTQAIGVIFGANIGTTVTAWIVSLIGFSFDIASFAIPVFGLGFFMTCFQKWDKKDLGEALMGFGLLFIGLGQLTNSMPSFDENSMTFMSVFTDRGILGLFAGLFAGMAVTVLLHSSSASTAIILTLSYKGILTWELAAAMVLGSNIGSTIDAILAAVGTKVNARRAALVHVLFNVLGSLIALCFFKPFLFLVDVIVPGTVQENITAHIATLHTLFNVINTVIFLPFVNQIAALVTRLVKPKEGETPDVYRLDIVSSGMKDATELYIIRGAKEIGKMSELVFKMFDVFTQCLENRTSSVINSGLEKTRSAEDYADQMQEVLSDFFVKCSRNPLSQKSQVHVTQMIHIVDDLENMSDECNCLVLLLKKSIDKKMKFEKNDLECLEPYVELVQNFLNFIKEHIDSHITEEELSVARELEDKIDGFRKNLKRIARKRLEQGADVKSELLFIDLVRHIEKIGDYAFSISGALSMMK